MMPRIAHRGFTLLELTIVLAIIALVAGAGMKMAGGSLKAADRVTTQERLATIKTALDSFSKTYGYLPCPANRTQLTTDANFGIEARNGGLPTACTVSAPGVVLNGVVWFGAVPVRTLGLPDYYAADAWGDKFTYAVSNVLKNGPTATSYQEGAITVRYGTRTAWYAQTSQRMSLSYTSVSANGGYARFNVATGAPTTGMIVHISGTNYKGSQEVVFSSTATQVDTYASYVGNDTGTLEWQVPGANAAYAVVSHGPDGRGAYPLAGSAIPGNKQCNISAAANSSPAPCTSNATTSCIDIENCNDDAIFFDTAYNDGTQASTYFDDYMTWGSNALDRTPVNNKLYTTCPAGACEAWCAVCGLNYPGGASASPPPAITSGAFLYKKVLNTSSSSCNATCFWAGNTAGNYTKAP